MRRWRVCRWATRVCDHTAPAPVAARAHAACGMLPRPRLPHLAAPLSLRRHGHRAQFSHSCSTAEQLYTMWQVERMQISRISETPVFDRLGESIHSNIWGVSLCVDPPPRVWKRRRVSGAAPELPTIMPITNWKMSPVVQQRSTGLRLRLWRISGPPVIVHGDGRQVKGAVGLQRGPC